MANKKKKGLTYAEAGVDTGEGQRLIELIKPLARATRRPGQIGSIGGFGSLFSARFKGMKDPVLVSGTDGVGTKLKVAFMADRHSTVGVDLVAMCVNDIITCGAEPLFFLDYFATGKLSAKKAATVIKGIAKGCKEAGCSLSGGETAEMPGMYAPGEYDLAGFAVGVVDRRKIITGKRVKAGDRIIGLASSGLHSNGYSLVRKVFFETLRLKMTARPKGLRRMVASELLTPTRIYVKPVLKVLKKYDIRAMAHITGGGFYENIPRALPSNTRAVVDASAWPVPPVMSLIARGGKVSPTEMLKTFNCGIGFVMVVRKTDEAAVLKALKAAGEKAYSIGEVQKRTRGPKVVMEGELCLR